MFELESRIGLPIFMIMDLFKANNVHYWYGYDSENGLYTIRYDEIESEDVADKLEDIALKFNL